MGRLSLEQIEGDVDDDGTVEPYQDIETDYARCEAAAAVVVNETTGDGFVSVIIDYQDRYIETRVLFETLEKIGWKRSH